MLFQTKVCGITSPEDALMCIKSGVDAIGLNFYGPSPRSITREVALQIADAVGDQIQLVGLFVNEDPQVIQQLHEAIGFDYIQLHGDEDPFYLKKLSPLPLIKAFRCKSSNPAELVDYLAACATFDVTLQAILLDAYKRDSYGGTGHQLNWETLDFKDGYYGGYRVILAGGITSDNVAAAIESTHPHAVDCASGVEAAPGAKDQQLVQQFAERARQAFANSL